MALPEDNKAFAKAMNPWPLDKAIEWIRDNMDPEDVFPEDHLAQWAFKNGFEEDGYNEKET